MAIKDEVAEAIAEIEATFDESSVEFEEDPDGGAYVVVDPVDPGDPYEQRETWIGFQITFQYPISDVYPHFVCRDLRRTDGHELGEGTSPAEWRGRPAIQISRRSNHLDPQTDTAVIKLHKVLEWLRTR